VEEANEALLLLKTTRARFSALAKEIRKLHSYENPEIIALPVVMCSRDYLKWIAQSVSATKTSAR
jgi:periplasmic divalent cation tolerance protein